MFSLDYLSTQLEIDTLVGFAKIIRSGVIPNDMQIEHSSLLAQSKHMSGNPAINFIIYGSGLHFMARFDRTQQSYHKMAAQP